MFYNFFSFLIFWAFRPVFFLNEIEKEYWSTEGRLTIFNWYKCLAIGTIPAFWAAPIAALLSYKFGIQSIVQTSCIISLAIGWIAIYILACLRSQNKEAVDKIGTLLVAGAPLVGCLIALLSFTAILISDPAFTKM